MCTSLLSGGAGCQPGYYVKVVNKQQYITNNVNNHIIKKDFIRK